MLYIEYSIQSTRCKFRWMDNFLWKINNKELRSSKQIPDTPQSRWKKIHSNMCTFFLFPICCNFSLLIGGSTCKMQKQIEKRSNANFFITKHFITNLLYKAKTKRTLNRNFWSSFFLSISRSTP